MQRAYRGVESWLAGIFVDLEELRVATLRRKGGKTEWCVVLWWVGVYRTKVLCKVGGLSSAEDCCREVPEPWLVGLSTRKLEGPSAPLQMDIQKAGRYVGILAIYNGGAGGRYGEKVGEF